jgi:hypothetical protein
MTEQPRERFLDELASGLASGSLSRRKVLRQPADIARCASGSNAMLRRRSRVEEVINV